MLHTTRTIAHSLPEARRDAQKILFTDEEWAGSRYHPLLDRFPHQSPPSGDDWTTWTVIGPPATGKTMAGALWVMDKLLEPQQAVIQGVIMPTELNNVGKRLLTVLSSNFSIDFEVEKEKDTIRFMNSATGSILHITSYDHRYGVEPKYLWMDDTQDAESMAKRYSAWAKQMVFTNPTKLPNDTIVSRPKIKD